MHMVKTCSSGLIGSTKVDSAIGKNSGFLRPAKIAAKLTDSLSFLYHLSALFRHLKQLLVLLVFRTTDPRIMVTLRKALTLLYLRVCGIVLG